MALCTTCGVWWVSPGSAVQSRRMSSRTVTIDVATFPGRFPPTRFLKVTCCQCHFAAFGRHHQQQPQIPPQLFRQNNNKNFGNVGRRSSFLLGRQPSPTHRDPKHHPHFQQARKRRPRLWWLPYLTAQSARSRSESKSSSTDVTARRARQEERDPHCSATLKLSPQSTTSWP